MRLLLSVPFDITQICCTSIITIVRSSVRLDRRLYDIIEAILSLINVPEQLSALSIPPYNKI